MDHLTPPRPVLSFHGNGRDLFVVVIVNWLLTLVTFGLYYPWAKARKLQYLYQHTELAGHPFHFHGTGREMFIGFIKAVVLFGIIIAGAFALGYHTIPQLGQLVVFVAGLILFPLIVHGTLRYRLARSSWRGIHFGYRGERSALYTLCLREGLAVLLTLGFYLPWFIIAVRNYTIGHMRYGDSRFAYKGNGGDLFLLNLKGQLLTIFTLGIYWFWWRRDRFHYWVDHFSWSVPNGPTLRFRGTARGEGFFKLLVGNVLLVVFTLGIGIPWAQVRYMRFNFRHIEMVGEADLDAIAQTEAEHKDATADDLGDLMDIGIFL
ncbi:MAG: DUF898 domain-containing protein [Flavobacteriales bacterium]|nr:DUF898 domain-containing protein [Flavobacteriales bacterium]